MTRSKDTQAVDSGTPCSLAIEIIRDASTDQMCQWWCELNSWGWPAELPGKPDDYEDRPNRNRDTDHDKYTAMGPLMAEIYEHTTERDRLYWWRQINFYR